MKKSDAPAIDWTMEELELPVEPGFVEKRVRVSPEQILERSESRLPERLREPGFMARRLKEKIDVEFRLFCS